MSTSALPDPPTLAAIVSNVTETMCGISFEPAPPEAATRALCWKIAWLPIKGERPIRVALSSDHAGCTALGSALFSCPPETLDGSMLDDSLCELLNMAAGQIKGTLLLDQTLGLPKILTGDELSEQTESVLRHGTVLQSRGTVHILIWISEGDQPLSSSSKGAMS